MVFNSDVFLLAFLPLVYMLFWTAKNIQQRYLILGLAGYVFYGWWNWRFCFLLLFSTLVSFFVGIRIDSSTERKTAWRWAAAAVTVDLSLLGFFKYYNFFAENVRTVWAGAPFPALAIVLPIGISFYTFHTISYVLDIYAGRIRATRNFPEYLTYVSLFPQLVAGPIVRFSQIREDLESLDGPPREDWTATGIGFFIIGLIKKVVMADQLATMVNPLLVHPQSMTFVDGWITALAYTGQLYFDFSGYSDMAVGLGYLFGLRIPRNFNYPYKAAGMADFWRRWHISLSTWLRDYLYFSMGGNRRGEFRTVVNLLLTMLIGGLWHGANWTFVVWGAYHGCLLIVDRTGAGLWKKLPVRLYQVITMLFVIVGWVIFRAPSISVAGIWLGKMFHPAGPYSAHLTFVVRLLAAGVWIYAIPDAWEMRFGWGQRWATVYALAFVFAYFFVNGAASPFLYFQF